MLNESFKKKKNLYNDRESVWSSSIVHASRISRRSDLFQVYQISSQCFFLTAKFIRVCVKKKKKGKIHETKTLAYGTTACYRIGCIIVLLLFTASTFLIVSHAQEQISSLVSPTRHYGHFKPFRSGRCFPSIV